MTRAIQGLGEIEACFDAVLADQFGVLHDGNAPFPGALAALEWLKKREIPVVLVSNSGRSAAANLDRLRELGFATALFRQAVTSGELAAAWLAERLRTGELADDDPVLTLASGSGADVLDALPLRAADADSDVRMVIIAGADPDRRTRESYSEQLRPLARRDVPALLCNPDEVMYTSGGSSFGPGRIAEDYRAAGGRVTCIGKPEAALFRAALRAAGDLPARRCLMIGDSPLHDIAGARNVGCLTLLIASGVQSGLTCADGAKADFRMEALQP